MIDRVYSIDDENTTKELFDNINSSDIKKCVICGKMFLAKGRNKSRAKVCPRMHHRICIVCGTDFIISDFSSGIKDIKETCSRKCSNLLRGQNLKNSMKHLYGVENPSQVPEFKEKAQKSIQIKMPQIVEHREKTMLEKYGAAYPMQVPELREKIIQTNLERYGYSNPVYATEIQQKISEQLKSREVQDKYIETCMAHYGVDRPAKATEIQEKMKKTSQDRYGTDYPMQNVQIKSKATSRFKEAMLEKYGVENPSQVPEFKEKVKQTMQERYGVDWPCLLPQYLKGNTGQILSKVNQEFASYLNAIGLETEFEFVLDDRSYDIHILDTNILIEINPTYTHNSAGLNHWNVKRDKDYHLHKTELAEFYGYRCIHIFDWESKSKIIELIKPAKVTYARKCKIEIIDIKTANMFLDLYHLQGKVNGQKICLGLYYQNELIQIMTFGYARYTKKYQWELLRLCSNTDYRIVGGAERLFKKFINIAEPKSIISYCDKSKFLGDVYYRLGMQLKRETEPNKVWSKDNKYITNNLLLSRGYDQLFNTNYGKGTSNEQLMLENGWLPVYDCGQKVFVWEKA